MHAPARLHLFSYRYQGADYVIEIPADNADDAKARIAQLAWARYDGEVVAKIPAIAGPLPAVIAWLRNLIFRAL
ncbi:hypothetical protein [Dongia sp.]|jgi:hypothetical protein|uniref:hypothetical protein n=1 Tax=Dongia sp. TaxID=1977262 RepID=UPI0035B01345